LSDNTAGEGLIAVIVVAVRVVSFWFLLSKLQLLVLCNCIDGTFLECVELLSTFEVEMISDCGLRKWLWWMKGFVRPGGGGGAWVEAVNAEEVIISDDWELFELDVNRVGVW
jgi:hypothetical protein